MPDSRFVILFLLCPINPCFLAPSSSDLNLNIYSHRRVPSICSSASFPCKSEREGVEKVHVFLSISWLLLSFSLVMFFHPITCAREKPSLLGADFEWMLCFLFNLHDGGTLCSLGRKHPLNFGGDVAWSASGETCPSKGHSTLAEEAYAYSSFLASSTSFTSRSPVKRSSRGPNPGVLLHLLVAAGVRVFSCELFLGRRRCGMRGA